MAESFSLATARVRLPWASPCTKLPLGREGELGASPRRSGCISRVRKLNPAVRGVFCIVVPRLRGWSCYRHFLHDEALEVFAFVCWIILLWHRSVRLPVHAVLTWCVLAPQLQIRVPYGGDTGTGQPQAGDRGGILLSQGSWQRWHVLILHSNVLSKIKLMVYWNQWP